MAFGKGLRKQSRRVARSTKRKYSVTVNKGVMPSILNTRLKYVEQGMSINPGAGTCAVLVLSGNGLWDPNVTAAGHQPRGFDQLMPFYDHYCVSSSNITATFLNESNNGTGQVIGIAVFDTATVKSNINDYLESKYVTYKIIGVKNSEPKSVRISGSPRKNLGMKDLSDSSLKGTASANPTEQFYYHVFTGALDNATDQGATFPIVTINYNSKFIEPKQVLQST